MGEPLVGEQRYAPTEDAAGRVIDGEALLVLPARGEAVVLNAVASRMWELIEAAAPVSAIVQAIIDEYDVSEEIAQRDVTRFCEDLHRRRFIAPISEVAAGQRS